MTGPRPGTPVPSPPPPQPPRPGGPGRFDEYLRVEEVAALWHCDKNTVYRAIYDGDLTWIDMRGRGAKRARIRVRRSAADAYMKAREQSTAGAA